MNNKTDVRSPDFKAKKRLQHVIKQNPNNTTLKILLFTGMSQLPAYETVVKIEAEQEIITHQGERFNRIEVSSLHVKIYTVDKSDNERIYVPRVTHDGVELNVLEKERIEYDDE